MAADPWASNDPLGEALHALRMSGVFYCRCEFTTPWALELPPFADCLMFHVVTSGRCLLEVDGAPDLILEQGDLGLLPHGEGHRIASERGVRAGKLFDLPRELVSERYEILRHGGGGRSAIVICGVVRFDHPAARKLIALLPPAIHLATWSEPHAEWLHSTLRFMADEALRPRPGGEAVITRLADILVIQAIRSWIAHDPAAQTGWLGALQDPQLGRALALIHREPARHWTVGELASAVAMSRSAFAARFSERIGETPMHYVARWKMQVAETWLRDDDRGIGELADRLGYGSEAAFSRAFKRVLGVAPGGIRRRARTPTA